MKGIKIYIFPQGPFMILSYAWDNQKQRLWWNWSDMSLISKETGAQGKLGPQKWPAVSSPVKRRMGLVTWILSQGHFSSSLVEHQRVCHFLNWHLVHLLLILQLYIYIYNLCVCINKKVWRKEWREMPDSMCAYVREGNIENRETRKR